MLTITATRGSRLVLSIPNYNVRKQYYEFMLEEYQDKRHINLNNLMDLFDEMAYEGHWRETLEFIAHAYKENSSVRSAMEGERNIQGFFTAYLSVNAYYLMAPEMELSHGYCDLFLMPDLMRYEVKHSYILELKYLSVKDTEEKARTQWQEAVKQINEYAGSWCRTRSCTVLSYSSGDGSWSGWKKCRPVQNNMTVRMKIHTGSQFTFRITLL